MIPCEGWLLEGYGTQQKKFAKVPAEAIVNPALEIVRTGRGRGVHGGVPSRERPAGLEVVAAITPPLDGAGRGRTKRSF